MIDTQNKLKHHIIIFIASFLLAYILFLIGYELGRVVGAIPFFILFLVLITGPLFVLWPKLLQKVPAKFPWIWRAELGIWFAIWSVIHVLFVFMERDWDIIGYLIGISPWALGALIAVFMSIILALISFKSVMKFLGVESWKWIQDYFTYVIFWLTAVHVLDRALLRPGFPSDDVLHWIYLVMFIIILVLQTAGFIKVVLKNRKHHHYHIK